MKNDKRAKFGIICPGCGAFIKITGSIEKVETKPGNVTESDILHMFPKNVRGGLKVTGIDSRFAKVELTSRYDKKKFQTLMQEVRGYGGRFVKGHFVLPIASLLQNGK